MTAARRRTGLRSKGAPVIVSGSLQQPLEHALGSAVDFELDDNRYVMRDARPYSNGCASAADQILSALCELEIPRAAKRRMLEVKTGLVGLLRMTPLDDLDGETLLKWFVEAANFEFRDDSVPVPADLQAALQRSLADAVRQAVVERMSIAEFAAHVTQAARTWGLAQHAAPEALSGWQKELALSFGGVGLYRDAAQQEQLVAELASAVSRLLKIRWLPVPRPPRPYSPAGVFEVNDTVVHSVFGTGEVTRKLEGKVEIRFQDGVRLLASRNA